MSFDASIPKADEPTSKSWFYIFLGFMGVATLASAAGILYTQFVLSRPIDIRPHTDALVNQVDEILLDYVAPENIQLMPTTQLNQDRFWFTFYPYEVTIPAHLDEEGITAFLKQRMRDYRVQIRPALAEDHAVELQYDDFVFAKILWKQEQPVLPEQRDLRESCYTAAQRSEDLLLRSGVAPDLIDRLPTVDLEDEFTLWAKTEIEVSLGRILHPDTLLSLLEENIHLDNLSIQKQEQGLNRARLDIFLENKLCTAIVYDWESTPEAPPVVAETTPEEPAPPTDTPEEAPTEENSEPETTEKTTPEVTEAAPEPEAPVNEAPVPEAPTIVEEEPAATAPIETDLAESPIQFASADLPPRIAIILDDGGYGGLSTERVLALDPRITLSILPNTPYATATAEQATALGFEVMLHMPMESHSKTDTPVEGYISTTMDHDEIQNLTRVALSQIPNVAGVNNHTGSKFTSNENTMRSFLEVLQGKQLYFVDSVTLHTSIAHEVAVDMKVAANERDVFLDNENDPALIHQQIQELVAIAKEHGSAIGIGHFRVGTALALEEALPAIEADGVVLVPASELVQ